MDAGNETLDRIQQEIQEALEREEELRNKYSKLKGGGGSGHLSNGTNGYAREYRGYSNGTGGTGGYSNGSAVSSSPPNSPQFGSLSNGSVSPVNGSVSPVNGDRRPPPLAVNGQAAVNGQRRFTPNPSAKGVMQKFLRMRGKLVTTANALKPARQSAWSVEDAFEPAKLTVEKGKPIRNGFVPAEEKMKKELQEFQLREDELRKERRKSQPDLMAALEAEQVGAHLKPAKSLAQMYNSSENLLEEARSTPSPGALRPSRSLAQLCDAADDEELDSPGTHSLIMQFEQMRARNA